MAEMDAYMPVLEFLVRQVQGTLRPEDRTQMGYPTPVSELLGLKIVDIGVGTASMCLDADARVHGNQQGTVHGGMLCELADAAIGTAHSTAIAPGESFTSIDLRTTFLRPVWKQTLTASVRATHSGRTISHYLCEIAREDGVLVATATSTVMTLRGEAAVGR